MHSSSASSCRAVVKLVAYALAFAFLPSVASAQCTDVVQDVSGGIDFTLDDSQEFGQSFVAPCDGFLVALSLDVRIYSVAATGMLQVYEGDGTAGALLASEPYSFDAAGIFTHDFSAPAAVVRDSLYTFFLDVTGGRGGLVFSNSNPFAAGTAYGGPEPADARVFAMFDFVFTADFAEAANTAAEPLPERAEAYRLSEPYPNPFNPRTTFTLAVKHRQHVAMAVYDALGRQVAVLFEGVLAAGATRSFAFEAKGLPSGVYTVRAVGEGFSASQSMTLLK